MKKLFFYLALKKNLLFLVEGNLTYEKLTSTRFANYFSQFSIVIFILEFVYLFNF